ncbi:hypothetical protein [Plantactinospora sonchi]|uniref:Bacterial Pleckstrin homology domain-containing protein n=1 Tax=Plantactinospora sonchi TaxID=1544735 RepID=A0ABU7RLJ8_9ACTN
MATIVVGNEEVIFDFTGMERLWLGRRRLRVPLRAVRQVEYVDHPLRLARGPRRGLTVAGHTKIGVWGLFGRSRQLVHARRGVPGLRLRIDRTDVDGRFDEVLVSTPEAVGLARAITRRTTPGARA